MIQKMRILKRMHEWNDQGEDGSDKDKFADNSYEQKCDNYYYKL